MISDRILFTQDLIHLTKNRKQYLFSIVFKCSCKILLTRFCFIDVLQLIWVENYVIEDIDNLQLFYRLNISIKISEKILTDNAELQRIL
jgi:hypothetical protein